MGHDDNFDSTASPTKLFFDSSTTSFGIAPAERGWLGGFLQRALRPRTRIHRGYDTEEGTQSHKIVI